MRLHTTANARGNVVPFLAFALATAALLLPSAPAGAQALSEDQLVQQLRPRPQTAQEIDDEMAARPMASDRAMVMPGSDGSCDEPTVASGSGHRNLVIDANDAPDVPRATLALQFDLGSYRLSAGDQRQLDALARALQHADLKTARYTITGHTDSRGDPAFNLKLSCGRSTAVRDYLVQRGVAATRLKAFGFGSARPIRQGDARDGASRRVEVRLDR